MSVLLAVNPLASALDLTDETDGDLESTAGSS